MGQGVTQIGIRTKQGTRFRICDQFTISVHVAKNAWHTKIKSLQGGPGKALRARWKDEGVRARDQWIGIGHLPVKMNVPLPAPFLNQGMDRSSQRTIADQIEVPPRLNQPPQSLNKQLGLLAPGQRPHENRAERPLARD